MKNEIKTTSGKRIARRLCSEIERCGLSKLLVAKYVPERHAVRIGVPGPLGSVDCAIDYPATGDGLDRFLRQLRAYASSRAKGPMVPRAA